MNRMLLLATDTGTEPQWLRIDDDGRVFDRGGAATLPPAARGVLVVPGAATRTIWMEQAAHSPAQARAMAMAAFAGDNADDGVAGLHVAVAPGDDGWMAVAVAPARMHEWLERAAAVGFDVDAMLPDYLLLPHAQGDDVQVLDLADAWLVRGDRLAFNAESGLAALVLAERPAHRHSAGERDALFGRGALAMPIDLLQGGFAVDAADGDRPGWTRRALPVLAAMVLFSPLLLLAAEALRYHWAAAQARAEAVAIAARIAPGFDADSPAATTGGVIARLRHGDTFNHELGALFAATGQVPGIQVETLHHDGDRLTATVSHPDAASLDAVLAVLEARRVGAVAGTGVPGPDGIRTELVLGAGA